MAPGLLELEYPAAAEMGFRSRPLKLRSIFIPQQSLLVFLYPLVFLMLKAPQTEAQKACVQTTEAPAPAMRWEGRGGQEVRSPRPANLCVLTGRKHHHQKLVVSGSSTRAGFSDVFTTYLIHEEKDSNRHKLHLFKLDPKVTLIPRQL